MVSLRRAQNGPRNFYASFLPYPLRQNKIFNFYISDHQKSKGSNGKRTGKSLAPKRINLPIWRNALSERKNEEETPKKTPRPAQLSDPPPSNRSTTRALCFFVKPFKGSNPNGKMRLRVGDQQMINFRRGFCRPKTVLKVPIAKEPLDILQNLPLLLFSSIGLWQD